MTSIGVRELKTNATRIVRNVRKRRARYVVTYRGEPVAQLVPLDAPVVATTRQIAADDVWNRLTDIGKKLADGWPAGVSSADILSDMRR